MPIIDTSFLYALVNGGDPHHAKAAAHLKEDIQLFVPAVVVAEFLQLVRLRANRHGANGNETARQTRRWLSGLAGFRLVTDFDWADAGRRFDAEPGISFVDAVCLSLAAHRQDSLWTFDERMAGLAKRA